MKGKQMQYLLLILVVIIWGIIAYRLYSSWLPQNNYRFDGNIALSNDSITKSLMDSFDLKLNYADPFLYEQYTPNQTNRSNNLGKKKESMQIIQEEPPSIIYKGYSLNNNSITRINLLINGKRYTTKPNSKVEEILISKCYRDSIIVVWKGKNKTIYRNGNS